MLDPEKKFEETTRHLLIRLRERGVPVDLPGFFSSEPTDLVEYGRDWTRRFEPNPSIILFPQTTEQVSQIVATCSELGVGVVPSGGRTGLAGGCVATNGEVVLSLSRMSQMGSVDPMARTLWVQAGAVTQAVHEHCAPFGLTWPVDFASKGSSHVGGNIATNAGGVRVIRFGLTRQWVLGLTVVLASGEILRLNGALEKNNTGMDLRQLFIGSEGILGIVTEAILKLAPLPREPEALYFACDSIRSVLRFFEMVRQSPWTINAFETLSKNCMESCVQFMGNRAPFVEIPPFAVLLEIERPVDPEWEAWFEKPLEQGLVTDAVRAQTPEQAREFWRLRENITESLVKRSLVHKHDVSVAIGNLGDFMERFHQQVERHNELEVFVFGHIGDGNLHINYLKPASMEKAAFHQSCEKLDNQMFSLLEEVRGSVSAEHGIGLIKKSWLKYSKPQSEIALMKSIKRTMDPKNILNPGKVLPDDA